MSGVNQTTPVKSASWSDFFHSKNFYVYLVCLALASLFWLLNALTKPYTTSIDLPIAYQNIPKDEVLISELPEEAKLEVESYGFDLLAYKLAAREDSVFIDVNRARRTQTKLNHIYAISTSNALSSLMNILPSDIRLKRILMDTVYFETQKLGEKLVPVIPDLDLSYDKQHMQEAEITIKPEMVRVTGAVSSLDTVIECQLKPLKLSGLNNDISVELDFIPIEGVEIGAKSAIVYIPVDQMTEKELKLPIQVKGLSDSMKIRIFPKMLDVRVQVPVSRYNEVTAQDFVFSVDYSKKSESKSTLYIEQEKGAKFCRVASYEPRKVEFVIEK